MLFTAVAVQRNAACKLCGVALDEIMRVDNWELAVNYFTENSACKLFLFSSSRRILSDKLTAVKTNKCDVVEVLPLSLPEFISFQSFKETTPENTPLLQKQYSRFGDKTYTIRDIYKYYTTYGGLPILKPEYLDIERARVILDGTYGAIVTRDILEVASEEGLQAVTDPILLRSVITIMAKSIGNNISAYQISKQTINCLKRPAAAKTVDSYIRALLNAHFFYIAERYDIRSGQMLKTMSKFYMADAGLHNYITGIRPEDEIRLLESKVFFELVRRGYQVYNGKLGSKEVHFVARDNLGKYYVQVVNEMDEENRDKTLSLLRTINDNHPKTVIVFNGDSEVTEDGIIILNALDFLMGHSLGR
ncbi:ATP-binding protein [Barnesiella intestinihominis]|uniref:ATP-binding protein n=1 Tax=Barnesiella intestinihominis TaxID=487174 RepID=UPI003AB7FF8B